jgi:hypothetical protein
MTDTTFKLVSRNGLGLFATALLLAGASLIGAVIAFFGLSFPVILLIGTFVAMGLMALRSDLLFSLAILFAFVIAGIIRYFAATNVVANVAPALLILLIFKSIFEQRSVPNFVDGHLRREPPMSAVLYAYAIFLMVVVASSFSHSTTSLALIFALKTYLPLAGLLVIAFVSRTFQQSVSKFWNLLLAIAVVQLPFIVYQHFFVATTRSSYAGGPSWDSVVGTMGGNPDGGGSSGALAIFLVLCLIYLINLLRLRLIRISLGIILGMVIFAGIALAEVKIVFVLLPIGIAAIFWNELKRKPATAIMILSLGVVGTLAVILIYQQVFWQNSKLLGSDLIFNLHRSLQYMLDPNYFRSSTGEVGRFAGLLLWWKEAWSDLLGALIGNGPGASRLNSLYIGDIARHYFPFSIDSTALVALLWDFGIVGTLAYFTMLLAGIRTGIRRLKNATSPKDAACIHTATIGILFLGISAIYNKDIIYLPQMYLLLALCLATALKCGVPASALPAK